MAIEHAAVQVVRKPWGVVDLHPWNDIDGSKDPVGELWFQRLLPYAVSDTFSNFATIEISALMQAMQN